MSWTFRLYVLQAQFTPGSPKPVILFMLFATVVTLWSVEQNSRPDLSDIAGLVFVGGAQQFLQAQPFSPVGRGLNLCNPLQSHTILSNAQCRRGWGR